jgi:hypothetical protein
MPELRNVKLDRARFHGAESKRQLWVADVEQSTQQDDIVNPAFWGNISNQMGQFDRIEVRCEDGSWIAELLVLEAGNSYARVKCLNCFELEEQDVAQSNAPAQTGYEVFYRGTHHKWAVKRLSDNEVVHNGESSSAAAHAWVNEHLKAVAA